MDNGSCLFQFLMIVHVCVDRAEQEAAVLVASLDSTTNDSEDMSKV